MSCVTVAGLAVLTGDATALTLLPVVVVFGLLLSGRYVGESRILRRLRRRSSETRRRTVQAEARSRLIARPRGAALIGHGLGRRGPPAPAVAA